MATIQVRVEDSIKASADALFNHLGLDTSTAIRIFLNKAIACDGLPFAVRCEPNRETLAAMAETLEIERNPAAYKSYSSARELFDELDAEIEAEDGKC